MLKFDLSSVKRLMYKGLDVICPPTCSLCQNPTESASELCGECMAKYLTERGTKCPKCKNPVNLCVCGCDFSRITKTVIGDRTHISLSFYESSRVARDEGRITEQMILRLKSHGSFARFFSDMLCAELEELFARADISLDDWILTYPPRSVHNFVKYGFDQSKEVTGYMARRLGIRCVKTFTKADGDEQKSLTASERADNAATTLIPIKKAVQNGGKYLLFDDIITSGSTITTAARHLYFCGAATVFPISIARTISG